MKRKMQRWLCALFVAIGLCVGLCGQAVAQSTINYTNTVDAPIPEAATPCTNQLIRTFVVPEIYTISDVNIGVVIGHARRSNLILTLVSPAGTSVTLFRNNGGVRTNLNVLFDSAQATSVSSHNNLNDTATATTVAPPFQRTFGPIQSLNAFNGQNANGTRTLSICDSTSQNVGTFFHATLSITLLRATLNVTKISTAQADFVSGANPKSLPGAIVRYCITISNNGPGLATTIAGTDLIPANTTYIPGSLRSGTDCSATDTTEDDNAVGTDEADPMGASVVGRVLSITAPTMANADSFALAFLVTLN